MARICILPKAINTGGVASFQTKLTNGLAACGIQTGFNLAEGPYDAVLLTGVFRDLSALMHTRRDGIRIVQRLDGINWIHRRKRTGLRHFLRAEYGNRMLALLRSRFADHVIYQSAFVRGWWTEVFGQVKVPSSVVHNGVDLSIFSPFGPGNLPKERIRLLLVEGSLQGGYEAGIASAIDLGEKLSERRAIEMVIVGKVYSGVQSAYSKPSHIPISWAGVIPHEQIPELNRSAHLLYSADINAACPNSVIEALACGLPVIGFSTGSLPELITGDSGRLVAYGGNPWKMEKPDISSLANAAMEIIQHRDHFSICARKRAEEGLGLELMTSHYLDVLLG